ncbi:aldo/keto reductase [Corynebacterium yudongzhengii]|nr:aldo/keto reductase [Corynebacterium yudongzhengii]
MKQRNMGRSGLRVSEIGLRTRDQDVLATFVDAGGTLIDATVASAAAVRHIGREQLVVATSVGVDVTCPLGQRVDCSRRAILAQVEEFLRATGLEHIDLLQVGHFDPHTPAEEVAATLDYLVTAGTVRYAGARGYRGWQLAITPHLHATTTPYSLLRRGAEEEILPAAEYLGIGVIAEGPVVEYDFEPLTTAAEGLEIAPTAAAAAWTLARVDAVIVNDAEFADVLPLTELPRTIDKALEEVTRVG